MSDASSSSGIPQYTRAYFSELRLWNIKSFGQYACLDLKGPSGNIDRWTVVVGENATGKSTILEGLYGLRILRTNAATARVPESNSDLVWTAGFAVSGNIVNYLGRREINAAVEVTIKPSLGPSNKEAHSRAEVDSEKHAISVSSIPTLVIPYTAARRLSLSRVTGFEQDTDVTFLGARPQDIADPTESLAQADYVEKLNAHPKLSFRKLGSLLSRLLPDIKDVRVSVAESGSAAIVEFSDGHRWFRASQAGYGYMATATWVVDLAFQLAKAFPQFPDPLQAPAVCLVDEIDLHLHPQWQRTIVETLLDTFPNVQFIVTAHSPIMVQASAGHNIVLLRRNKETGFVDIVNDVDEIANWRLDQILTSELFGFDSARPAEQANLMSERIAILSQPEIREEQKARLAELEAQIGPLARGETADEVRMNALLDAAIGRLSKRSERP